MPRSVRLLGVVVLVTGAWTALVPFAGPSIGFAPATAAAWTWSASNWQLGLVPGLAAAVAGLTMLLGQPVEVWVAKLIAYAAGVWLLIGPVVGRLWLDPHEAATLTAQIGSDVSVVLGYVTIPGLVLVTSAALGAGRRVAAIAGDVGSDMSGFPLSVGEWA